MRWVRVRVTVRARVNSMCVYGGDTEAGCDAVSDEDTGRGQPCAGLGLGLGLGLG